MHPGWNVLTATLAAAEFPSWLINTVSLVKVIIGFSFIIFVHELGHFLAAKWVGVRVDRFAIGFGYRLFGWRRGEGLTFGKRPDYSAGELAAKKLGETDYCFKILPVGGYVKMLGQDDIQINDETGEIKMTDDPRSFTNQPVGRRMLVVSAGVIFNILFAILGFMCVFMIGKRALAPQIGLVAAGSPAAQAGLRPGDVILSANGDPTDSWRDLIIAQIVAEDGRVAFRVQRSGRELPGELVMQLPDTEETAILASGFAPSSTTELVGPSPVLDRFPDLATADVITHVAGRQVHSATDFVLAFSRYAVETGRPDVEITLARPNPLDPEHPAIHTTHLPVTLRTSPSLARGPKEAIGDSENLLGLCQRRTIDIVIPGKPGDDAGLLLGDVLAQWDSVPNPLYSEIVASIQQNARRVIPVLVERDGETVETSVTPKRPFRLWSTAKPLVGLGFGQEERVSIVANVADGTPAANLRMPRGARIISIDDHPVESWFDVVRLLKAAAGRTVTIRFRSGQLEATGQMSVPSSIVNELDLPPLATIVTIEDETRIELEDNLTARLPSPFAVRALLAKHAGQTVTVEYQVSPDDPTVHTAQFTVAPDASNADPWQMRISYLPPELPLKPLEKLVQTSNPLTAVAMGITQTGDVLTEVYLVIKSIAKNALARDTSTVQHISGPVGIVDAALTRAKQGYPELLFFLAFLSVNLAVINFLPFPVVDGGLMVFLIIEKLKGKPLSIKTQMVATLVGLATIILVFLLVTFQDITKWLGQ